MISEERRFLKLVDLYTQVVESGSTWGVQNDEDVVITTYARRRRGHRTNFTDKYTFRQSAHLSAPQKDKDFLTRITDGAKSDEFTEVVLELNQDYLYVRTGSPIRKPQKRVWKRGFVW